jgi:hypothetical protein
MATVTKYAQSNAAITTGWTNPTNAYADNGSYATCAPGKNASVVSDFYNFAFGIPTGATINSVTFEFQYKASTNGSNGAITLQPILNTTLRGTAISGNQAATADTTESSTATGDWSLSELNDNTQAGGFKLRLTGSRGNSNTAVTRSVDYVKATVDYTPAVISGGSTASVTVSAQGSGTKTAQSGASAQTVAAAQGSGTKIASGGAAAGMAVSSSGGGEVVGNSVEGGSTAAVAVSSGGSGIKIARAPPSETGVEVSSGGGGVPVKQSGATAGAEISPSGGGVHVKQSGATAGAEISPSGSGSAVKQGGATAGTEILSSGGGLVTKQGGSGAQTTVSNAGAGAAICQGGSNSAITISATGSGAPIIADYAEGGDTAGITVSYNGAGTKTGAGGETGATETGAHGSGEKTATGGGAVSIVISVSGGGAAVGDIPQGGSTAGVIVSVSGGGGKDTKNWIVVINKIRTAAGTQVNRAADIKKIQQKVHADTESRRGTIDRTALYARVTIHSLRMWVVSMVIGNTVKMILYFKDFSGAIAPAVNGKLEIYESDSSYESGRAPIETIALTVQDEIGSYTAYYTPTVKTAYARLSGTVEGYSEVTFFNLN